MPGRRNPVLRAPTLLGVLIVVMGTWASPAAGQAASELPGVLSKLAGSWVGSGELLGRPASFRMEWRVQDAAFVRLRFANAFVDSDGNTTPVLTSEATYLFRGETASGVWIDDRPQRLTLEATATDSSLVTLWTAPSEEGRTEYVIEDATVVVRDFVGAGAAERFFAEAVYRRGPTKGG